VQGVGENGSGPPIFLTVQKIVESQMAGSVPDASRETIRLVIAKEQVQVWARGE